MVGVLKENKDMEITTTIPMENQTRRYIISMLNKSHNDGRLNLSKMSKKALMVLYLKFEAEAASKVDEGVVVTSSPQKE